MIAYLGTGLLGANFVKAMLNRGLQMQVWNRTSEKAFALEPFGAKAFENAIDAVKGASAIHLTLKDDASVDEVLAKASMGFSPGTVVIDHTTTSAAGAVQRTKFWEEKGIHYQHAPVFMGPQNALDATGVMLVSGDQELISKLEPELTRMTGRVLNFGSVAGKAAAMKLIGNLFLITFTTGLADALTLAGAQDISLDEMLTLFEAWNPAASSIPARLKKMDTGDFSRPSWELNMARKDTQLFMTAAQNAGKTLSIIPTITSLMDRFIAEGYGHADWTIIGQKQ